MIDYEGVIDSNMIVMLVLLCMKIIVFVWWVVNGIECSGEVNVKLGIKFGDCVGIWVDSVG